MASLKNLCVPVDLDKYQSWTRSTKTIKEYYNQEQHSDRQLFTSPLKTGKSIYIHGWFNLKHICSHVFLSISLSYLFLLLFFVHQSVTLKLIHRQSNVSLKSTHTHFILTNSIYSKITTLEWLRERGGDFSAKTRPRNQTPMHFAAARGQVQTLKWLCENTQALGTFKIQKLRFSNCVTIIVVIIVKVIILTWFLF